MDEHEFDKDRPDRCVCCWWWCVNCRRCKCQVETRARRGQGNGCEVRRG